LVGVRKGISQKTAPISRAVAKALQPLRPQEASAVKEAQPPKLLCWK